MKTEIQIWADVTKGRIEEIADSICGAIRKIPFINGIVFSGIQFNPDDGGEKQPLIRIKGPALLLIAIRKRLEPLGIGRIVPF